MPWRRPHIARASPLAVEAFKQEMASSASRTLRRRIWDLRPKRHLQAVAGLPGVADGSPRADRPWEPLPDGRVLVRTWSPWDPFVLGVEERAWIEAGDFGRFEAARLRELVDHEVLVATGGA